MNIFSRFVAFAGILLALVSLSFLPAAAQSYTVTDLGTMGGTASFGNAINDRGQVVGSFARGTEHAFLWSEKDGMRDLGVVNQRDTSSVAYGINNLGEVVGHSFGGRTPGSAFLWTKSEGMHDIGNLGGEAAATAINDSEQVVGNSYLFVEGGPSHAFLWTRKGGMQDLGTLGGSYSSAYFISQTGEVVGESFLAGDEVSHAFVWTRDSGMQDLGPPDGPRTVANAISPSGQIVGWTDTGANQYAAVLWDRVHGMQVLSTPAQGSTSALGINSAGEIIGYYLSGPYAVAALWGAGGGMQNLNRLVLHDHGVVNYAYAINRVGQIVALNDHKHALLLTPTN